MATTLDLFLDLADSIEECCRPSVGVIIFLTQDDRGREAPEGDAGEISRSGLTVSTTAVGQQQHHDASLIPVHKAGL